MLVSSADIVSGVGSSLFLLALILAVHGLFVFRLLPFSNSAVPGAASCRCFPASSLIMSNVGVCKCTLHPLRGVSACVLAVWPDRAPSCACVIVVVCA